MIRNLLALLFIPLALYSEMRTVSTMKELPVLITPFNPHGILIIFDIDQTLSMPKEPTFQRLNYVKRREFLRNLKKNWSPQLTTLISNLMVPSGSSALIEKETPAVIHALQSAGYKTIALTGTLTGPTLDISQIETWRTKQLNELRISFQSVFSEIDYIQFEGLHSNLGSYPTFQHGLLLSNGDHNTKSDVLLAFLKRVKWMPSTIVFVEDTLENLQEMEKALENTDIQFLGVHYKGADEPINKDNFEALWLNLELKAIEILASWKVVDPEMRANLWFELERRAHPVSADSTNYPVCITVDVMGRPWSRVIGSSDFMTDGTIHFFTNTKSNKVKHMKENEIATFHYWLPKTKRQISVRGLVKEMSPTDVAKGWSLWNRRDRLVFLAVDPDVTYGSFEALDRQIEKLSDQFSIDVPLPQDFVGYHLIPEDLIFFGHKGSYGEKFLSTRGINGQWTNRQVQP